MDFACCGRNWTALDGLLQHFEEAHPQSSLLSQHQSSNKSSEKASKSRMRSSGQRQQHSEAFANATSPAKPQLDHAMTDTRSDVLYGSKFATTAPPLVQIPVSTSNELFAQSLCARDSDKLGQFRPLSPHQHQQLPSVQPNRMHTYFDPAQSISSYKTNGMDLPPPLPPPRFVPATLTSPTTLPSTTSLSRISRSTLSPPTPLLPSSSLSPSIRYDTTGQISPPHAKKLRLSATLWEMEGVICFHVDIDGHCIARREDNNMINGTKLLNFAGETRGRRDAILKSEETRVVCRLGPSHLKGVWIPFERALEFANERYITALLHPLFAHNIIDAFFDAPSSSLDTEQQVNPVPRAANPLSQSRPYYAIKEALTDKLERLPPPSTPVEEPTNANNLSYLAKLSDSQPRNTDQALYQLPRATEYDTIDPKYRLSTVTSGPSSSLPTLQSDATLTRSSTPPPQGRQRLERREHRKSRLGCFNCKRRRIKVRPFCDMKS